LLVLANGIEMASKLEFDHSIVPITRDEFGLISEIFNQSSHLLKTRINLLHAIFRCLRVFAGLLDKDKVVEHSIRAFKSLEEASEVVIALWDPDRREMVVESDSCNRPEIVGLSFSKGQGIFGRLLLNPEFTVYAADEYAGIAKGCEYEMKLWGKSDSVVVIPMLLQGKLKGAVALYKMNSGDYELDVKKEYLQGLADQIAIFLENTRLYRLVSRDQLTGLYTHSFLEAQMGEFLKQAKRYNYSFAFIMLDLDHFKRINDEFGHAMGNRVLNEFAKTLRSVSRDSDLLARYGGDEFEILLPQTDEVGALAYAEKLRKAVEKMRIETDGELKIQITVSVGLAPMIKKGDLISGIQSKADSALYEAKAQGRNCVSLYRETPKT
jgi:diguanylate cyclase (GGDEF)-like protein